MTKPSFCDPKRTHVQTIHTAHAASPDHSTMLNDLADVGGVVVSESHPTEAIDRVIKRLVDVSTAPCCCNRPRLLLLLLLLLRGRVRAPPPSSAPTSPLMLLLEPPVHACAAALLSLCCSAVSLSNNSAVFADSAPDEKKRARLCLRQAILVQQYRWRRQGVYEGEREREWERGRESEMRMSALRHASLTTTRAYVEGPRSVQNKTGDGGMITICHTTAGGQAGPSVFLACASVYCIVPGARGCRPLLLPAAGRSQKKK